MLEDDFEDLNGDVLNVKAPAQRNVVLRGVYAIIWFIIIIVFGSMLIGAVIGMFTISRADVSLEGSELGVKATNEFFSNHSRLVLGLEFLLWGILVYFQKLPGISKWKSTI